MQIVSWKRLRFPILYSAYLLILLEAAARIAYWIPINGLWSETSESWRGVWTFRHGGKAEVYYRIHIHDPTKGWRTAPNLNAVKNWGLAGVRDMSENTLTTDAWGFRGTRPIDAAKDPHKLRILLLGDSFTFGDEVSDDETFSHYLQDALPDAEVINAGVSGYGHDQMLIMLSEVGPRFRPDIVIVGFLEMDMDRNRLSFRDYAKPRFDIVGDELVLRNSPVPTPDYFARWGLFYPRFLNLAASLRYRIRKHTGEEQRLIDEITRRLLAEIVRTSRSITAVPVLAYLPAGSEITGGDHSSHGETFFDDVCASDPQLLCVTTQPEFARRLAQGERFELKGHWGANGHRAVSDTLAAYLRAHGLTKPPARDR